MMKHIALAAAAAMSAASASAATLNADVVFWSQGVAANGAVDSGSRRDPDNALGAADGNFLSLGLGGWAVFGFGQDFAGSASVVEITYGCPDSGGGFCGRYREEIEVLTSNSFSGDLAGFMSQGTIKNGEARRGEQLTLAPGDYRWLALRDISPIVRGRDGFDIDAVSVGAAPTLAAVPLPASALLLGVGLVGVSLMRRRRG